MTDLERAHEKCERYHEDWKASEESVAFHRDALAAAEARRDRHKVLAHRAAAALFEALKED